MGLLILAVIWFLLRKFEAPTWLMVLFWVSLVLWVIGVILRLAAQTAPELPPFYPLEVLVRL